MNNDKKYNIVLGLMIFFFILFVGTCIAFGLGFIGINKVDAENDSMAVKEQEIDSTSENFTKNASLLEVSNNKCLNNSKGMTYKYQVIDGINGVSAMYDDSKLTLNVEEGNFSETFESEINIELYKEYEIRNIDLDEVAEISFHRYGFENIGLFFLMKDGTVRWLDIVKACTNNDFSVSGKITGVKEVVRISTASRGADNGSATTVIGMKSDGSFYDLMP